MLRHMILFAVMILACRASMGVELPQRHEYQRVLREYIGTLQESDFVHGVAVPLDTKVALDGDPEYLYRQHLMTLMQQPLVGWKRGTPAVNAPPRLFLLQSLEGADSVMVPPVWPDTLMAFVQWDYLGNVYRGNRALKMRAFVAATVKMVMYHEFAELNEGKQPRLIRPDWHGYAPSGWALAFEGFRDVLPEKVQQAFITGLKMVGERILAWDVSAESCESDLRAALGLVAISKAVDDKEFEKIVKKYVERICSEPAWFNKTGYWVERGGPDLGFGGAANYYAVMIALQTDWPFVTEALQRSYRLRGYLAFPDPDGHITGPSHFNSRLGSAVNDDQFQWDGARDAAVAMVTDEAEQFVRLPDAAELAAAPGRQATWFNFQISQNIKIKENGQFRHAENEEITNEPWKLRLWESFNFPVSVNPACQFYRAGRYRQRLELEEKNAPILRSPYLRGENFIRNFGDEFVAVRQNGYAALLHVGRVGEQHADDGKTQFKGPMGFGGGQISAFWTPAGGSMLLGLRNGMSYDKSFDDLAKWRTWPMHTVMGVTTAGVVFTPARIVAPTVAIAANKKSATISVAGTIPLHIVGQEGTIAGKYSYSRTFTVDKKGIDVATNVSGDSGDTVAELYEIFPVYWRDASGDKQKTVARPRIDFMVDGKWHEAGEEFVEKVTAARIGRFEGEAVIKFAAPQRVGLAAADWQGTWLNKMVARNILVDLLGGKSGTIGKPIVVKYTIEAVK